MNHSLLFRFWFLVPCFCFAFSPYSLSHTFSLVQPSFLFHFTRSDYLSKLFFSRERFKFQFVFMESGFMSVLFLSIDLVLCRYKSACQVPSLFTAFSNVAGSLSSERTYTCDPGSFLFLKFLIISFYLTTHLVSGDLLVLLIPSFVSSPLLPSSPPPTRLCWRLHTASYSHPWTR